MVYVKRNDFDIAELFFYKPENYDFVVDENDIPEGNGILKISKDGRFYYVNVEDEPEYETVSPGIERELLEALIPNQSNPLQAAEQLRRTMVMYASSLDDDRALEVATIYPEWQAGVVYKAKDIISHGLNQNGDPQLYRVVKDHTSQADWVPGVGTESLYTAFGLTPQGYPVWKQPAGAHDAYKTGDIVDYNGKLYRSKIDGNVWSPDAYPQGWELYTP